MGKLTTEDRVEIVSRMKKGESGRSLSSEYKIGKLGAYDVFERATGETVNEYRNHHRVCLNDKPQSIDIDYFVYKYGATVEEIDDIVMVVII